MPQPTPKIPCPKCDGSGTIELPKPLTETLRAMRVINKPASPEDIHAAIVAKYGGEFGVTAVCNRLTQLMELHFVDRQRDGKGWLYFRVKTPTPESHE